MCVFDVAVIRVGSLLTRLRPKLAKMSFNLIAFSSFFSISILKSLQLEFSCAHQIGHESFLMIFLDLQKIYQASHQILDLMDGRGIQQLNFLNQVLHLLRIFHNTILLM